jgi:hypothetical protein
MSTGKVFVTGKYENDEIGDLLRRERPDLAWFASVVPETWCFTLSHAIRAGLRILAFDLGALGERLRDAAYATLVEPDIAPPALNEHFLRAIQDQRRTTSSNEGNIELMNQLSAEATQGRMTVSVQVLTFPEGIYAFLVRSAPPAKVAVDNNLLLPAVQVARGPDADGGNIEFMSGVRGGAAWLSDSGDVVMARVTGGQVSVVLTSLRTSGAPALSLEVQRIDARSVLGPAIPLQGGATAPDAAPARPGIAPKITAHVQNRGDLPFVEEAWAGLPGQRLWIESFVIEAVPPLVKGDIEYKGLTATGFETAWLGGGSSCGTRGMGIPLVAFSVRMKPSARNAAQYDCEYSGRFLSGATIGPLRNGAPCRSASPDDPLEAIQLRIIERPAVVEKKSSEPVVAKPVKRPPETHGAPTVDKVKIEEGAKKSERPGRAVRRAAKSQTAA